MKINVGSGKDYREGYINIEPNELFPADIRDDIRNVSFEENSLDEILAQDVIDHVTYMECRVLLRKFYTWLKPNGLLNIHLPNFENLSKWASEGDHESMIWIHGTDGKRASYDTNFIKWSYTPRTIKKLLRGIGFIIIPWSVAAGFQIEHFFCSEAEEEEVFLANLLADLDVRTGEGSDSQGSVHREFHITCS